MPVKDRKKTSRGDWIGGVVPDDMDEALYAHRLDAFIVAAGWRGGRGNKPHLQLIFALVELFRALESEGIARPVNYINSALVHDGRLPEVLGRFGLLTRPWWHFSLALDVARDRDPHERTTRQELDVVSKRMRRLFVLAEKLRRDIFAGVTSE